MKKVIASILMVSMICILTACGSALQGNGGKADTEKQETIESKWMEMKRKSYDDVEKCIYEIEDMVKNPASLKIKDVYWECDPNREDCYEAGFYVAAQNDMGNDKEMYINIYNDGQDFHQCYEATDFPKYTSMAKIVKGRSEVQEYYLDEGEGVFSTFTTGGDKVYIFRIDLDDYEAQGYWLKR